MKKQKNLALLSDLPLKTIKAETISQSFIHNQHEKQIIKGYKRFKLELDKLNCRYHRVKGIKASIFKFQEKGNFVNVVSHETVKTLAAIIKSTKGKQAVELNFSKYRKIKNGGLYSICKSFRGLTALKHLTLDFSLCAGITDKGLRLMSRCLKRLYSLQSINIKFTSPQITKLFYVCKNLKKLRSLQKINLSFKKCNITNQGAGSLKACLKRFQKLQSCYIDLGECPRITEIGLKHLGEAFRKRAPLQSVGFDFSRCQNIANTGLESLAQNFLKRVSLRHVHMSFASCQWITDLGIQKLGRGLQSLPLLHSLDFDFRNCNGITGQGTNLGETFSKLTSLESLKLNFSYCQFMRDGVLQEIGQGLNEHPSLRKAVLWFRDVPNLTHVNGIQNMCKGLQTLTSLEYIDIDFGRCHQMGSTGMQTLFKTLKKLTSLKTMNLDFYNCPKVDLKMMNLDDLTSLQYLHFSFGQCKISDVGMEKFGKLLERNTSLVTMLVGFTECSQITDIGIQKFSDGLQNLASLQKLRLILKGCRQITDKEITILSQSFKKLISLQELEFYCADCTNITDNGLKSLSQSLSNLVSLRKIDLVSNKWNITDTSFCDFGKRLQMLSSLESLSFSCTETQITRAGIFLVGKILGNMTSLNWIDIDLRRSGGSSPPSEEIEKFKSLFRSRSRRARCVWSE